MMKRLPARNLIFRICMVLLVMTVVFPSAGQCRDTKENLIHDVFKKSGMKKQSEQIPAMLSTGFEQASAREPRLQALPPGFLKNIRLTIETVFKPEMIEKAILNEMRRNMGSEDLTKVLEWLDSKTGGTFARMEEKAGRAEAMAEQQAFFKTFDLTTVPEKRQELYRKLDKATNATAFNTDMVMNMQLAITIAIVATLPEEQRPSRDRIMQMIEQSRPQIEASVASQTFASFMFIYKEASTDELEKYIAFSSTPEGTLFNKTTMEGFKNAMLEGCFAFGGVIADMLKQKPEQTET